MDVWDFKKWRRRLKYSQIQAAEQLGFRRAAVQHWESEKVAISEVVQLACEELTLKWRQRPEFGPVTLIYADEPVWPAAPGQSTSRVFVQCELYSSNEAALKRAGRLNETRNFINPLIVAEDGSIIWAEPELRRECAKFADNAGRI
jgi:DNA-binding XRE family transcriptional regulator